MIPAPFRVVLDANVLYPFTLRDTLLRAAAEGLFQAHWSDQILDEATRNLVEDGVMSATQAARLRGAMAAAFPEAVVAGHETLIAAMKNDEKDRHVAAAAVKAGAQVIVTANLDGFRDLPDGLEAQSPDEFLSNLFDLAPDILVEIVRNQAADLRRPSRTFADVLRALDKVVPVFAASIRERAAGGATPRPCPGSDSRSIVARSASTAPPRRSAETSCASTSGPDSIEPRGTGISSFARTAFIAE